MATARARAQFFNDFTGGLNTQVQRQNLALNETPDCLNVDFSKRGGLVLRRGYRNVTTDANMSTTAGYLVGQFSAGTDVVWGVSNVGRLWTWDGSAATHVATAITDSTAVSQDSSPFVRGAAWGDKLYFANCRNATALVMRYWNGTAFTTLTNTANDNYTAPTSGNAPLARLIADHAGFMWWADTIESGTVYRSRLRFSHYLQPENWANADYFDIEPDDRTDRITALVPFKNVLLVFKQKAVFAVYGTSRDDFTVERIAASSGAVSQEAVSASAGVVYWWSADGNVFAYNGRGVLPIGNQVMIDLVRDGTIRPNADHRVCWAENRLYVSVVYPDGTTRYTYVYDPSVGSGAWTKYDFGFTSMVWWRRASSANGIMFRIYNKAGIFDYNVASQQGDYDGTNTVTPSGYYRTSWFSASDTALLKRWKRLRVTASVGDAATLNADVFYDFDESTVRKTLQAAVDPSTGTMLWGSGTWGTSLWAGVNVVFGFERLPAAGRSHAVQFKFYFTNHVSPWTVDSFTLPYLEKGYR